MRVISKLYLSLLLLCLGFVQYSTAFAQDASYPNRPIKMIVPLAPGGATDTVARIFAKQLSIILNTPVMVDNRVGAGGIIAMDSMTKVPSDGYTVFIGNLTTNALNQTVHAEKMKIKPDEALSGVSILATIPHRLVSSSKLDVKNMKELIAYVKANPGKVNHASPGTGSYSMLDMLLFERAAGLDMVHVPYNGGAGQYIVPMVSNEVQIAFINASSVIEMIRAGKLRAIAVTTDKRLPELPNVPTMAESGFPGIGTNAWQALFVPKGVSKQVIDKLFSAIVEATKSDELVDAFKKQLIIPGASSSPDDFNKYVRSEVVHWASVLQSLNVKGD